MFEEVHEIQKQRFDSSKFLYSSSPNPNGGFADLGIQQRGSKQIYFRKYLKLQELMALIGGIANLFIIIIQLLNSLPANFDFKIYLFNKFYDLPSPTSHPMIAWLNKNKSVKLSSVELKSKAILHNLDLSSGSKKVIKDNFFTKCIQSSDGKATDSFPFRLKELGQRFKIHNSVWMSIKFLCLSSKSNFSKHIIEKSFGEIKKNLSIEAYFSLLRVVAKLKYFLLSGRENFLFDNLGDPLLIFDESPENNDFTKYSDYIANFSLVRPTKPNLDLLSQEKCKRKIDELEEIFKSKYLQ